jgi:hypothetical protein
MPPEALKLLERMRRSKGGWTREDLDTLYRGFGFEIRHRTNHDVVTHSKYPQLRETLPRHRTVKKYLVQRAVKLIDKLLALQADKSEEHGHDE